MAIFLLRSMKLLLFACLASVGHAVILEKTPFKRLIPADVLRGKQILNKIT